MWCSNEDECTTALSHALESTDEELFDAVPDHILKLTAEFVPYGKFFCFHIISNLPSTPVLLSLFFSFFLSLAHFDLGDLNKYNLSNGGRTATRNKDLTYSNSILAISQTIDSGKCKYRLLSY